MGSQDVLTGLAWAAPRILFVLGLGFLVANVKLIIELLRYQRQKRSALLTWPTPKPRYYNVNILLAITLALLLAAKLVRKQPERAFGEAMMFIYYGCVFPLTTRIARGFYRDGVWSDTGFMRWAQISAVSWKEEGGVVLILISHVRQLARRLQVPGHLYGQARRVLREKIREHALHIGGVGLDLGSRDETDAI